MKTFLLLLAGLYAFGAVAASLPFGPSEEAAIQAIMSRRLPSSAKGVVRAVWDVSGNSTVYGSSTTNSGVAGLGVYLPKNALITDSYFYVNTAVVADPQAQFPLVAFQCEDASNILAATKIDGRLAGQMFSGKQHGMSSLTGTVIESSQDNTTRGGGVDAIASGCEVQSKVTIGGFSAGKVTLFLEYVLSDNPE